MVTETPQLYRELVKLYMESTRVGRRLTWVYNILAHQSEAARIVSEDTDEKWDRKSFDFITCIH
ncbi:hypothetical protein BGX38DRAFT_1149751 [Terfezia claveryi]|nr:hypothetical protein BGX38DRAFT_1149751 [Terfezia claveryi]